MKRALHGVIAGILLAACSAGAVAQAIDEVEDETIGQNYPNAQPLVRGVDGRMVVNGVIGVTEPWGTASNDVDLYSFYAAAGTALTFDIDQGIKTSTLVSRSVDTTLSLLGPGPTNEFELKRQQSTCLAGKFGISVDSRDACILNFSADRDGIYIIAVTADPVLVIDGGHIYGDTPSTNGSYTLIVTGASNVPPPA
ncbi:MAG: hypothetical protein ACREVD_03410, partial [Burkholderiales bacterium]